MVSLKLFVIASVILLYTICLAGVDAQLIIPTTSGFVSGKMVSTNGADQFAYLGIPYAQPPINQLRFKPPEPANRWDGVLNTTQYRHSCPQGIPINLLDPNQPEGQISEDCLYLNIFTSTPSNVGNMSVLVWIHGGGFIYGSGAWWQGQTLSANEGIVVVTINYRLGVFGFLTSGEKDVNDRSIKANLGLQDQNLALRWIRDNIENFGGNKDQITIAGNSAGAVAVSNHIIMPSSQGLFHRAILQSGVFRDIPSYYKTKLAIDVTLSVAAMSFIQFSTVTKCHGNTTTQTVNCLKTLSTQQLLQAQFNVSRVNPMFIVPVVDGDVLPESSYQAISSGRFNKVDVMLGTTLNDGYYFLMNIPNITTGIPRQNFINLVNAYFATTNQRVKLSLQYQYTNWANVSSPLANRDQFGDLLTDYFFAVPTTFYADLYSRYVPTYAYIFAHRTAGSSLPSYVKVVHTLEISYVFGYPLNPPVGFVEKFSAVDQEISRNIMSNWGNFIRQGNPTDSNSPVSWPRYTQAGQDYMWIATTPAIKNKYYAKQLGFWNQYLPQLVTSQANTAPSLTPTSATTATKSHSLESTYMIAMYVMAGVAGLLLLIVVILFCKLNKANRLYVV